MAALDQAGCGLTVRAGGVTAPQITHAVSRALDSSALRTAAIQLAQQMQKWNAGARFSELVRRVAFTTP
jgi:UDP:flavonoid glycosyltransferase YjiC (YdhE family)